VVFGRDGRTCEGVVLEYLNTNVKGPRKIINQEHKKTNRPGPSAVPLPLREHMYKTIPRARSQSDTHPLYTFPPAHTTPSPHIPQTRIFRSAAIPEGIVFRRHSLPKA